MTIALLFIATAAAGVALAYYVKARRRPASGMGSSATPPTRQRAAGEPGRTARFASVEIKVSADPCAAARAMVGDSILAANAPALPLKGCDRQCRCAFIKRSDRRQEGRRWSDAGIAATLYAAKERRHRGDRRRRS
jgi:hypothetical protein